jgi:hypothetical protein
VDKEYHQNPSDIISKIVWIIIDDDYDGITIITAIGNYIINIWVVGGSCYQMYVE